MDSHLFISLTGCCKSAQHKRTYKAAGRERRIKQRAGIEYLLDVQNIKANNKEREREKKLSIIIVRVDAV